MTSIARGADAWIRRYQEAPDSEIQLLCFPYAGGSASYFLPLSKALTPSVEVRAVQYPGRQDRYREPCVEHLHTLADAVVQALREIDGLFDKPLALFGHSMGATLAYEVALRLEKGLGVTPAVLFASGRRGPSTHRDENVRLRDDDGLVRELRLLDGTNGAVFQDEELLRMALPAIRGDYSAIETYRCVPGERVSCPITVLTGDADPKTTIDEARAWQEHTTGAFELQVFPGGHFFLNDQVPVVVKTVAERLRSVHGA
ncbi:alpha/beta fold hydrolase [Streptomyces sp. NPDC005271]|uniref:thioesterase II family protein n=1 Tax=unclassified Streptomyces TaxID=2593676 RepID=UPI0033A41D75